MKIKSFLKTSKMSVRDFCNALEDFAKKPFPHETVRQWVAGNQFPRPERAKIIVALSKGKITFEDIYKTRHSK